MRVKIHFFSYFRDLAGAEGGWVEVREGSTVGQAVAVVLQAYPRLAPLEKSMLVAVGVEYLPRDHELHPNDELAFFPPVQGG